MPLEAGGTVELEIQDAAASSVMRGGLPETVIEKSVGTFEAAIAKAKPVALAVIEQFADAVHGTTSVRVKFGLKFNTEAGAIIASIGSEANFAIEIVWGHDSNR
jgi:hypothetical protein